MLQLVTTLRLLDVAAILFTAIGCVFAFVAAGDGAVGSIAAVDVVDLDVDQDVAMLLTTLMMVPGSVGCSYRCC